MVTHALALTLALWLAPVCPSAGSSVGAGPPERLAPGIISTGNVYRGSFAPDGHALYFFKKVTEGAEDYRIFVSRLVEGRWTLPERVALGGEFSDMYPAITSDGRRLIFSSYRPAPAATGKPNANLWYVDRNGDRWGEPVFMAEAGVAGTYHSWVHVGRDGEVYFRSTTPDWTTQRTLVTRWNGRAYTKAVPFEPVERWIGWRPDIRVAGGVPSPDGKAVFLDVTTIDPGTNARSTSDIWVSAATASGWTEPAPLGQAVNTDGWETFPFFSPDGRDLYFVRDFDAFYRIPLREALGP